MRNSLVCLALVLIPVAQAEDSPQLGKPVSQKLVEQWNLDIFPDGEGLPTGKGTAVYGKKVYQQTCLSCHGVDGTGDSADELAGAKHGLTDNPPDKTIGTYWPYATTIFDFTRRSMPLNNPGSLTNSQLYAVTAYLLYLNGIISEKEIMNAETLPNVKMPNRDGFISYQSK
ncbi:MAG: c-type cytochrome [Methylococcales bacterium]|nr:c-type cytochrome [Methylococcales bacterium]